MIGKLQDKDLGIMFKYKHNLILLVVFIILLDVLVVSLNVMLDFPIALKLISIGFIIYSNKRGISEYAEIYILYFEVKYKNLWSELVLDYSEITNVKFIKGKGGYWVEFYFLRDAKLNSFTVTVTDYYYASRIKKALQKKEVQITGDLNL